MAAKVTIERILRDPDDCSGQTIRSWTIEAESGFVMIRKAHSDGFILLRSADVDIFKADLDRAKEQADSLKD